MNKDRYDESIEALLPSCEACMVKEVSRLRAMEQQASDQRQAVGKSLPAGFAQKQPQATSIFLQSLGPDLPASPPLRSAEDITRGAGLARALAASLLAWAGTDDSFAINLYLLEHGELPPFAVSSLTPHQFHPSNHPDSRLSRHQAVWNHLSRLARATQSPGHMGAPMIFDGSADHFDGLVHLRGCMEDAPQDHQLHALARATVLGVPMFCPQPNERHQVDFMEFNLLTAHPSPDFRAKLFGDPAPRWDVAPLQSLCCPVNRPFSIATAFLLPPGFDLHHLVPFAYGEERDELRRQPPVGPSAQEVDRIVTKFTKKKAAKGKRR